MGLPAHAIALACDKAAAVQRVAGGPRRGIDMTLSEAATALCRDVSGVDWNAEAVQADVDAMLAANRRASPAQRAAAFEVLLARLRAARVEDADGVAHVAISAGTLVESGAPARPLAEVMLTKLPDVLVAARRFADTCLADLPSDAGQADALVSIDERAIPLAVFRRHVAADRPGACALHRLREWVLPAIAALTRDREQLVRACADRELVARARALRDSAAWWLHVLLGVELDARWLVLCPLDGRGFHITVDGVVSNFDLHTLVASALIERGIAGKAPPAQLIAFIERRADDAGVGHVEGVWNYYTWRAAAHDLAAKTVPIKLWVWNEGVPKDVPMFEGTRTLLIGPAAVARSWNVGRTFSGLSATVRVADELPAAQVRSLLEAMKGAG